jgi:molybdopterin molybdotransferase
MSLTPAEALDLIRSHASLLPSERRGVGAELLGRVLAADVRAAVDLPPFATSSMDGYAVRSADLGDGPLPIAFRVAAGDPPSSLPPGAASGIATGAPLPDGADAVVPVEDAREVKGALVAPAPAAGAFVRPVGEDVRRGGLVAARGTRLEPATMAAIAAAGVGEVDVVRRPALAVIATGSELIEPGRPLGPGQIYESNVTAIAAQALRAGGVVVLAETVPDDPDETRRAFARAIEGADLVVSSGGVSVGPHDHVKPALLALGVREVFWRVAHKPGRPIWFGVAPGGALVFGLPGNPVSSVVCFELFVREAIDAQLGVDRTPRLVARLAAAVPRLASRDNAVRCRLVPGPEGMTLVPQDGQESHLIVHAGMADALALVERGSGEAPAGLLVEYVPL